MMLVRQDLPIPKVQEHNPILQDHWGMTVAILLATHKKPIPPQWCHDPAIKDIWGYTVAMYMVIKYTSIIPPEWEHNASLQNNNGQTVAMLCLKCGVPIPKNWEHNPSIHNYEGDTVESLMGQYNLTIPSQWRVLYKRSENVEPLQCMVCQEEDCTMTVETKCGHVVCWKCSEKYYKHQCPYCKCKQFRITK